MTKARDISKLLSTANGKIAGENLDVSFENITDTGTTGTRVATGTTAQRGSTAGQLRFNSTTNVAEYYDGTDFKVIDIAPIVTSISPSSIDESDLGSSQTIVITGSSFALNVTVSIIGADSTVYNPVSTTRDSDTQITITTPTNLVSNNEPYGIKVENSSGLFVIQNSLLSINDLPAFAVASGSLGTLPDSDRSASNLTSVTATDEENDAITFSQTAGTLPTGITFNSNGTWSGTANAETSDQTYNFTITATSGGQTVTRNYSITVTAPRVVEYLVIAGGGGGGNGGGGAGGYRNSYASETSGANSSTESTINVDSGTTYTITVGAGGASWNNAGTGDSAEGIDSSILGTGITTITSLGGGGGGNNNPSPPPGAAKTGGSGGGGQGGYHNGGSPGASGTANQGSSGGNGTQFGSAASSGGGGGAGGSGSNGSSGQAGNGGSGLSSSITGSSVSRAGGGAGGGYISSRGTGSSGGGNGGSTTGAISSSAGTANTGGGGGGDYNSTSSNGGSGVVILRILAGVYSGTTTGSPTVTDDGSYKVLTFTGSGSYTA